uniref:Uncharacterized protein n=1 Tax=Anguilla anguilla TaxID=7936 RepID=A0A0E9RXF0_ANGAN
MTLQSIFATSVKTEQDGLGKDGRGGYCML